jgi:glycosyltransferase involved in cell wall biosynthesis
MIEGVETVAGRAASPDTGTSRVGVVIIGRNEGQRLITCLESILCITDRVVYVDSGSNDGSVDSALARGAQVVSLDMSRPFTAARARNAGMARLVECHPTVTLVQFVDGDCEMAPSWIPAASAHLLAHPGVAAVCGRLKERYPQRSVYNRLCDAEWDRPPGETDACGGIFMVRRDAFERVGGFRDDIVAGEEPELCSRLRAHGLKIWRMKEPMALHDAAMTRFGQWWMRSRRGGFASALLADVPGYLDAAPRARHNRGIVIWALVIPLVVALGALTVHPLLVSGLLVYPFQVVRLARRSGPPDRRHWESAAFMVLGKFPALLGLIQYHRSRRDQKARTFDYKS